MTLSCSNNCIITRSNWKHVTLNNVLGNPHPFLMESNLKLSKIPRLHRTILDASQELIPQLLSWIENGLTRLARCVLASTHTRWSRLRGTYRLLDEVNGFRREHERKPIVWNLSFSEMTPSLYTGVQHERVEVKLLHYSIIWYIIVCLRISYAIYFHFLIIFPELPQ